MFSILQIGLHLTEDSRLGKWTKPDGDISWYVLFNLDDANQLTVADSSGIHSSSSHYPCTGYLSWMPATLVVWVTHQYPQSDLSDSRKVSNKKS